MALVVMHVLVQSEAHTVVSHYYAAGSCLSNNSNLTTFVPPAVSPPLGREIEPRVRCAMSRVQDESRMRELWDTERTIKHPSSRKKFFALKKISSSIPSVNDYARFPRAVSIPTTAANL